MWLTLAIACETALLVALAASEVACELEVALEITEPPAMPK